MTIEFPALAKPPIKEAILQLWVDPGDSYSSDSLKQFVENEKEKYPTSLTQRETLIQFMAAEDGQQPGVTDKGVSGFKISSEDGKNIIQVFKDRLVVSRLEPYTSWPELMEESMRAWGVYLKTVRPKSIKKLSVRYINHFLLPPNMESFEDYLESTPNIPADLPQGLSSFYVSYELPDPETGALARTQLLFEGVKYEVDSSEPILPIILDTDSKISVEARTEDVDSIRHSFELLHDLKNRVFFNTVKEKALEIFR